MPKVRLRDYGESCMLARAQVWVVRAQLSFVRGRKDKDSKGRLFPCHRLFVCRETSQVNVQLHGSRARNAVFGVNTLRGRAK